MFTRKQYMNKECTHHEYYSQFLYESSINAIISHFGKQTIVNSKDENFNDIPLYKWDAMISRNKARSIPYNTELFCKASGSNSISISDHICIMKSAATVIRDKYKDNNK